MHGPDPLTLHPLAEHPRVTFLKPLADGRENVSVGEYSYYDDPEEPERFFDRNVLYHYAFLGDRLEIGRFCAIGTGARFVMNGANHALGGLSTFPFNIFGQGWDVGFDTATYLTSLKGNTVVGPDVWIGARATVLPGVTIGAGAVIGTEAVVGSNVPPYAIVVGNPARILRLRLDEASVATMLDIAWWDWPAEKITDHLDLIRGGDAAALLRAARQERP
jgi:virginiamycin A acetyltransferase